MDSSASSESPVNWAVDTLHVHLHGQIEALDRLTDAKFVTFRTLIESQAEKVALALDATEKAIGKAEVATAKAIDKETEANANRFASVNEFRQQLNDQAQTFLTRQEFLSAINSLNEKIADLKDVTSATGGGRRQQQQNVVLIGVLTGVAALVVSVVVVVVNVLLAGGK